MNGKGRTLPLEDEHGIAEGEKPIVVFFGFFVGLAD